jgi:hypothetical protein
MTCAEVQRAKSVLQDLAHRRDREMLDWVALAEDTLRNLLTADSQLLARFTRIRAQVDTDGKGQLTTQAAELAKIERELKGVIRAAGDLIGTLGAEQASPSLEQEIECAIQKGYFKSWPFRLVIGGLFVVIVLITGVASFKITEQVRAMQQQVDNARKIVGDGQELVFQAKSDIVNKHAELTTLLLEGSQDLLGMRVKAVSALDDARRNYLAELDARQQQILSSLDEAGKKGSQQLEEAEKKGTQRLDERTKQSLEELTESDNRDKARVAGKVQSVIQNLEASKRPWIPIAAWSIAKPWLILPLVLLISLFAWLYGAVNSWRHGPSWIKVAVVANAVLFAAIMVLLYVRA